ncbi:hypothetical protein FOA52_012284 [Chlamydomonas sp. UWO 241]|nr:hypothetical protein FOA52_012284 [Chlamydomonas sp. UWO 241]
MRENDNAVDEDACHIWHDAQESWDALDWPLHRAAFTGDVEAVRRIAGGMSRAQMKSLDPQGQTALHVAVLMRRPAAVGALLECGAPAAAKSESGWAPLHQAVEQRDRDTALALLQAEMAQVAVEVKARKHAMLDKLWQLPDFTAKLSWEISSTVPGVGYLLRTYAPHDTFTIWKQGDRLRMDGTLMGVEKGGKSVLPEWKRGHFSAQR